MSGSTPEEREWALDWYERFGDLAPYAFLGFLISKRRQLGKKTADGLLTLMLKRGAE